MNFTIQDNLRILLIFLIISKKRIFILLVKNTSSIVEKNENKHRVNSIFKKRLNISTLKFYFIFFARNFIIELMILAIAIRKIMT